MEENTLISIIRGVDPDDILAITECLLENGVSWLEISLSDEKKGLACIQKINDKYGDHVNLGVGTVIKKEQVDKALEAGARYIITPGWDRALAEYVLSKNITIFPGVYSPGEIMQAASLGIQTVKVFPAIILGLDYIKNIRGPFPHTEFMAVGGVNQDNIKDFKEAGYTYFAIGSNLVPQGATKSDLEIIGGNASDYVHILDKEEV